MRRTLACTAIAIVAVAAVWIAVARRDRPTAAPPPTLVLYCATDREIAQDLIDGFERETGIRVQAKFDTEAAKSVGLVQAIRQERSHPQCDVLWGGQAFFQTMLANDGCLAPAPADLIAAHGSAPRDPGGTWLGFAGVYRILIVNTDALPNPADRPRSYLDLTNPKYKGHVGIANPLFGGMAGHLAALYATTGEPATRRWLRGLRDNGCAICAGMADVRDRVASGELWVGITSTVDAHVGLVGGKPVAVVYPDQGPGQIGCLNGYNAVSMVAGGPHPREGAAFLRYLLRPQTERLLSTGPGQNIGMLPGSVAEHIRPAWIPADVRSMDVDWAKAAAAHPAASAAAREILLDR
jgi:iron(III) transport system substrate-binding protein